MAVKSLNHLYYLLDSNKAELNLIINTINSYYYEKKEVKKDKRGHPIPDGKGGVKIRIIHPSKGRLKEIQRKISTNILKKIKSANFAFGGVVGKDNIKNAIIHKGKKYKFCTDLKDFFPSITNRQINQSFIENGFSPDVAHILTILTTYKGCLPQGSPTSTLVANLVFEKTGKQLEQLCVDNNITFSSYVDDLSFSSNLDFKKLTPKIISIIEHNGFRISQRKTGYKIGTSNITGIQVANNFIKPSDAIIEKLNNKNISEAQFKGIKNYVQRIGNSNKKIKIKKDNKLSCQVH